MHGYCQANRKHTCINKDVKLTNDHGIGIYQECVKYQELISQSDELNAIDRMALNIDPTVVENLSSRIDALYCGEA